MARARAHANGPGLEDMLGIQPALPAKVDPHWTGHRERLRQRLFDAGASKLPDYELLEVLLFTHDARKDVKELAKSLISRFGSFAEVLSASPDALRAAKLREPAIANLMAAREAALRLGKAELRERSVLNSWDKLIAYCSAHIARNQVEEFHLLFLNAKNELIAHEQQGRGTINHTPVYTREVLKRALELGAAALIMVHNHFTRATGRIAAKCRETTVAAELLLNLACLAGQAVA
ncbi:MAG: DNA repair protein RadC [Alphaproteobacteria bacterium]|nr:DNA repair protein RadC [Alphaproteobacteria bacterium]